MGCHAWVVTQTRGRNRFEMVRRTEYCSQDPLRSTYILGTVGPRSLFLDLAASGNGKHSEATSGCNTKLQIGRSVTVLRRKRRGYFA